MATRVTIEALSGGQLRDMFAAAAAWLEKHIESVNAINVFPVPDGDTGTNMYLTMRSVMEEAQRCPEGGAGAIMAAMSQGALMGARGNSGVSLSQIIRGMTRAVGEAETIDASTWVRGLEEGAAGAYKAVTKPVEGTILTVMREASEAARQTFDSEGPDILGVMEATLEAASQSLERTPTLLPVLAEAGVVDAGGKGLLVLLDGMTRHLKGEPMDVAAGVPQEQVGQEWLAVTSQLHGREESLYGYCTEFLVGGEGMEPDSVRNRMLELGDSAKGALQQLEAGDPHIERRQLGLVDRNGNSAARTGAMNNPWAGHTTGRDHVAMGNGLVGEGVVQAMAAVFLEAPQLDMEERLTRALEAGQQAGGEAQDSTPHHSAALLVYGSDTFSRVDLRVDEHITPVAELRRLLDIFAPKIEYFALRATDPEAAQAANEAAEKSSR